MGGIFKLSENWNLGATIQSPTWLSTRETLYSSLSTNFLPGATGPFNYGTVNTYPNDLDYRITSPLRSNLALAYYLPKKVGVLNAEIEYVGYSGMNVRDSRENISNNSTYLNNQKEVIQNTYKDVLNIKVGGELRYQNFRVRAGINYLPTPVKATYAYMSNNQIVPSLGIGFKNAKYYADMAYKINQTIKSAYTPYTVSDNTAYASSFTTKSLATISFTFGTYFGNNR